MRGKTCRARFPALLLPLFQFFPFFLPLRPGEASFFGQPLPFFLILLPFFPTNMTDRLRGRFPECPFGVGAGLELTEPFAQPGHTEISVHAGRLDRRVAHENHSAGTFADKPQTYGIQSGMKLVPTCGALDDGMAAFLSDTLGGLFTRGAFKILGLGLGLYLRSVLEIPDHAPLLVDTIAGVHL